MVTSVSSPSVRIVIETSSPGYSAHSMPGYQPVSKPYEMVDLVYDLVVFARYMLVPGGRLVFFLPTVTEDWDDLDVPLVEGMKEIKFCTGSSQDFGRWSRRVSTPPSYRFRHSKTR